MIEPRGFRLFRTLGLAFDLDSELADLQQLTIPPTQVVFQSEEIGLPRHSSDEELSQVILLLLLWDLADHRLVDPTMLQVLQVTPRVLLPSLLNDLVDCCQQRDHVVDRKTLKFHQLVGAFRDHLVEMTCRAVPLVKSLNTLVKVAAFVCVTRVSGQHVQRCPRQTLDEKLELVFLRGVLVARV